ncbi:MAG: DUF11 domain-containing protein [Deltaproteobacteria bacterium]|nr:DUF11 domain-containing protein [Deltaproteobacteria bacterium]
MQLNFFPLCRRVFALSVVCLLGAMLTPQAQAGVNQWTTQGPERRDAQVLAMNPNNSQIIYIGSNDDGVFKTTNGGTSWTPSSSGINTNSIRALAIHPTTTTTLYAGTDTGVFQSTDSGGTWTAMNTGLTNVNVQTLAIDPNTPSILYAGTTGGVFKFVGGVWSPMSTGLTTTNTRALAIDRTNTQVLYAATSDGVFKSTNGAANWAPSNTGLTNTNLRALAINPNNTQVLYVGTSGSGVFVSVDGGANWTVANNGLTASEVRSLAIHPNNSAILYAGSVSGGVFKSTDSSATWSPVNTGLGNLDVRALAIDRNSTETVYAGTFGGGAFKSTNGAQTWAGVNVGLATTNIQALAMPPSSSSVIYAGSSSNSAFKSTNGGTSWTSISTGISSSNIRSLAIDPQTQTTVYAGTSSGVFKTTNGGTNWAAASNGMTNTVARALAIDPNSPQVLYVGTSAGVFKSTDGATNWTPSGGLAGFVVQALAIHPSNPQIIYAGTSTSGVQVSINGGMDWNSANNGLTSTNIRALAIDPNTPQIVYAGASSGVFKTTDGGGIWTKTSTGLTNNDVRALAVDRLSPAFLYVGVTDGGVFASSNGANSWSAINNGLTALDVRAVIVDPLNSAQLYAGTFGGGVFEMELPFVDLSVAKLDSPDPITVNKNLTYNVSVLNKSTTVTATGLVVTDSLPADVTLISILPPGICSGTTNLSCNLGSLTPNTTAGATITVRPTVAGSISNTVHVQGNEFDPSPANNDFTAVTTVDPDADGDGFSPREGDCDDQNPARRPNATETCNGIDDNCNTQIDEGVLTTYYRDVDGDGFGTPTNSTQGCSQPVGYVTNQSDCNDANNAIHPNATEVCNGIDDNCNTQTDEGVTTTYYRDADNDGFGNPTNSTQACTQPAGYVADQSDCNDANNAIHPGVAELCNGLDDNCNSQIDEGLSPTIFYRDADGDGFGDLALPLQTCAAPPGYVANNTDCNDAQSNTHPGAVEFCGDGFDQDCDGHDVACPLLHVISPDGGETWPIKSLQTIQWDPQGVSGQVKLELSRDGGQTWKVLRRRVTNNGFRVLRLRGPATSQAKIRVSSVVNPGVSDTSDLLFNVQ